MIWDPSLADLSAQIRGQDARAKRKLIALAGAPGSGKSTLAEALALQLNTDGCKAAVVPMDGFHLDNRIIEPRGDLPRKGGPHTFDPAGLARLLPALAGEDQVYYPLFDRSRDCAIAGAGMLSPQTDTVIVEGNYLLLDHPEWANMAAHWDMTLALTVPVEELERRLIQRWIDHGLDASAARTRALSNDLPNARTVVDNSRSADITIC